MKIGGYPGEMDHIVIIVMNLGIYYHIYYYDWHEKILFSDWK